MPTSNDADTFKLSVSCSTADCKANTTFTYTNDAEEYISQLIKQARESVKEDHAAGRHTKEFIEGSK